MKKFIFPLLFILLFILSFTPYSNDDFYWYLNEKISIKIDGSKSLIIYEREESLQEIEKYIGQDTSVISFEKTPYKAIKVHFKSSNNDKNWLHDLSLKYPDISFTDSFQYEGDVNYMLNEVTLKPKKSIADIITAFGKEVKVILNQD